MHLTDTIIASSSAPSGGVRGIVRLSGAEAWRLAGAVVQISGPLGAGYHGPLALPLLDARAKVAAVLLFKGPRSFTGEDVAEIQLPNSPAVLRACIDAILECGQGAVRLAGPGEFSARAFFNGKIDLTEAEGIAATINAANEMQLRAAAGLREGVLHKEMARLSEKIADILAGVEAGIDFSDEEGVSFVCLEQTESTLEQLGERLDDLLAMSVRVDRLDVPPTVVFIGRPNVGKSSLINALSSQERSIVSHLAGTTRDILAATMRTEAGDIRLLDVPGDEIPSDELRGKMMDARRLALMEADLVIRVVDHTQRPWSSEGWTDIPAELIVVQNKVDLIGAANREEGWWLPGTGKPWGCVSAKTGENLPKLREVIVRLVRCRETVGAGEIVLNQRHRLILQDAKTTIWHAASYTREAETFAGHPELLAADLRRALDLLGQITGAISPDEVLGRIFSRFCIGK